MGVLVEKDLSELSKEVSSLVADVLAQMYPISIDRATRTSLRITDAMLKAYKLGHIDATKALEKTLLDSTPGLAQKIVERFVIINKENNEQG